MTRHHRGLSLVELLVITAIIVVLAAVLAPVFRVASPAVGETESLANLCQVEKGMQLYYADYDHTRMGRQSENPKLCLEWKQIVDPYVSSHAFDDTGNPAAAFKDGFSDEAVRAAACLPGHASLGSAKVHTRGFYFNNLFGSRPTGAYFDMSGLRVSSIAEPGHAGDVVEGKDLFTDQGPFTRWTEDVDSSTAWLGSAAPVTGLHWNTTGDHYGGEGMNTSYIDGHAAFVRYDSLCDPWIQVDANGNPSVTHTDYKTFWNFSVEDIKALGPGFNWMTGAVQGYCVSRQYFLKSARKP